MLSHTPLSRAPEAVKVKVRPARISDLPTLVELLCQLFSIETDFAVRPTRHARGLRLLLGAVRRGRAYVAVAESRGEVVGMATVQVVVSTAEGTRSGWIEDVVVREDLRGVGIGTMLMADVAHWARANNLARLQLLADRRNRLALTFYDRLAFQTTNMICLRARCPGRSQPVSPGKGQGRTR
jgi:ribosomal protein S18 acetylase RimI-like enzyme